MYKKYDNDPEPQVTVVWIMSTKYSYTYFLRNLNF